MIITFALAVISVSCGVYVEAGAGWALIVGGMLVLIDLWMGTVGRNSE